MPKPDLAVPDPGSTPKEHRARAATLLGLHRRPRARSRHAVDEPLWGPELATVSLLETLPHPPQPPHVTVPVPAFPPEDLISYFAAPPVPVVCRPTRRDRFKPDLRFEGDTPVLCTADNP